MPSTSRKTDPTKFKGYPIDLIQGLVGMGRAIIGDDQLFAAVQAYEEITEGSDSAFGPALLAEDPRVPVQSLSAYTVPEHLGRPAPTPTTAPADEGETGWEALDLDDLIALAAKHDVTIPGRVKTHGKVVQALEAAGITPPKPD